MQHSTRGYAAGEGQDPPAHHRMCQPHIPKAMQLSTVFPGMHQAPAQRDKTACSPVGPGLAGTVYWQPRYKELGYVRARKRQCKPSMAQLGGCPPHMPRSHQFRWDTTQHRRARLPCLVRDEPAVSVARCSAERSRAVFASMPEGRSTTSQLEA